MGVADLQQESEAISRLLSESAAKNRDLDARAQRLEEEHNSAVVENARARRALGDDPSIESYRRTKEQERSEADETLAKAVAECKAEMAHLESKWATEQAQYHTNLEELAGAVHDLQLQFKET